MPRRNLTIARLYRQVKLALEGSMLSGKALVVAVSGGPDSLALLYALHHLRSALSLRLHGAHLNHRLRGAASSDDADFVAETFESLGISFTLEQADVSDFRRSHRLSLEEAAREVRYSFLARVASEQNADAVALGHTADDQAETILMHLVRGSGLTGLRGMEAVVRHTFDDTEVTLVRPLLGVSRRHTVEYCRALGLTPREDESNLSPELRRNRVRLELMPLLEQYNPAIRDALVRLSRSVAQDMAYIESQIEQVWHQVVREDSDGLFLNRSAFLELAPALRGHLLRRAVLVRKGDLEDVEQNHVDGMARLIDGPAGKSLDLPGGLRFSTGYEEAMITAANLDLPSLPPLEGEYQLEVPGETLIGDWQVTAAICDSQAEDTFVDATSHAAYLDYAGVGRRLSVRSRVPGDRFQPLGMAQSKKLQDFMVDSKIPRSWRDRVPLVVSPRGIVWVVGWRIADWARVNDIGGRRLELRFTPV